jgi:hypothetical protein
MKHGLLETSVHLNVSDPVALQIVPARPFKMAHKLVQYSSEVRKILRQFLLGSQLI